MDAVIEGLKFFKGGNATFTIHNDKDTHFTYKIRKPKEDAPFFVSLLSGPDMYRYMGIYNPTNNSVYPTAKSKISQGSTSYKVLTWALNKLAKGQSLPDGYGIHHEGKCCRCGRPLTTPESIATGIGPICSEKM